MIVPIQLSRSEGNRLCLKKDLYADLEKPVYTGKHRALAKIALGNYAAAIADFGKDISLDPKLASAYNGRGYVYYHYKLSNTKENYRKAILDYDLAVQLGDPGYKPDLKYRDEPVVALDHANGQQLKYALVIFLVSRQVKSH